MTGLWALEDTARVLRAPTADDQKYSRGVVGMRTGSQTYPGAAVLGVEAAWRTGVGMVRYLGPAAPTTLVLARRPETVTTGGRVQAWVIGSGTDAGQRGDAEAALLREILAADLPVIVDAGALDLVDGASAPLIVTPHEREHTRLRELLGLPERHASGEAERAASARQTAARLGGTIVLKGSVTVVASADGFVTAVSAGTPWLATAGTGDVLAGAIGAVVAGAARADRLGPLAAAGVWLHGRAGTLAATALGAQGGPITALDVAAALPRAVAEVVAAR